MINKSIIRSAAGGHGDAILIASQDDPYGIGIRGLQPDRQLLNTQPTNPTNLATHRAALVRGVRAAVSV
jgi:hypothetical protein